MGAPVSRGDPQDQHAVAPFGLSTLQAVQRIWVLHLCLSPTGLIPGETQVIEQAVQLQSHGVTVWNDQITFVGSQYLRGKDKLIFDSNSAGCGELVFAAG